MAELLQTSENNLTNQKYLTAAEVKAIKAMNLDEVKEKRAEFLKLKALEKNQEAKFKRVKSIKSKRYRKIARKEREKAEEKSLATLERDDPLQFKEVLAQLEKKRMQERMSLKHKNTSKWAKAQNKYAKYSDRAREQVQEQLELSKQLTRKLAKQVEEEDDNETQTNTSQQQQEGAQQRVGVTAVNVLANNPWMKMMGNVGRVDANGQIEGEDEAEEEASEHFAKPAAFVDTKELEKARRDLSKAEADDDDDDEDELIDSHERHENATMAELFRDDDEEGGGNQQEKVAAVAAQSAKEEADSKDEEKEVEEEKEDEDEEEEEESDVQAAKQTKEVNIEPIKLDKQQEEEKATSRKSAGPRSRLNQLTLSEAFADDDVVEEFQAEKVSLKIKSAPFIFNYIGSISM